MAVPNSNGTAFDNMNGEYIITPTPKANGTFNTKWSEYPGGVEYFEMHVGPITSLYSQVWWKTLPKVALPKELIQRFEGKGMAIVGYEVDQVRRTPEGDVSVPINVAYNHHHDAFFVGKGSKMQKVPYDAKDPRISPMARADPNFVNIPVEHTPSPLGLPTSAHLAAGNGGEYRKSYHGFAAPTAYVIDSPQTMHVTPMQIDTWNREEMNITGSRFVPGPLPKHSLAPRGKDALYSGLLECPLTDRVEKIIQGGQGFNSTYSPNLFQCASNGTTGCGHVIQTAEECFDAAKSLDVVANVSSSVETNQVSSDTMASGCTFTANSTTGAIKVYFNAKKTEICCGAGVSGLEGTAASLIDLKVKVGKTSVELTLTGPSDVWYGAGFYAQSMQDAPYAIIIDGNGKVSERRLENHAAGDELPSSVTVQSNTITAGLRTVIVTRGAQGMSKEHASFSLQDLTVPFITAIGSTVDLSYHQNKTASSVSMWPTTPEPVCMCEQPAAAFGSAVGNIKYLPTGEEFGFVNYCLPEPRETVLAQRNPTCDVRAYAGGLQICKHMWSLLDSDQEQPWPDQPLVYYQKYRFYFQAYQSPSILF